MAFNLEAFRQLAFGNKTPDHAIASEEDARRMVSELPVEQPEKGLAELTHWARSINDDPDFSPELRGRIFMQIDVAAHPLWRPLGAEFLAPGGQPSEGRDGNPDILHALRESAAEFANGYRLCLTPVALKSRWVRDNFAILILRRIRWHTRRMQFSRMLKLAGSDERWAELHEIYRQADEQNMARLVSHVFPGTPRPSSVKQEYLRPLLGELARPDRFLAREFELMFRIIGRIAASVQLESERPPDATHAIIPEGSQRPFSLARRLTRLPDSARYIDMSNAVPRVKALRERHNELDPASPDPAFGGVFTVRERRALIDRLLEHWTDSGPKRRGKRIPMQAQVVLLNGFENASRPLPGMDQGERELAISRESRLRIQLDAAEQKARASHQARLIKAILIDASTHGMGIVVNRAEARWAKVGALLAICMQPGRHWVVGVVRRVNDAADGNLHLGVAVIVSEPRLLWFLLDTADVQTAWDHEVRRERNFFEHYQRGIIQGSPALTAGELLLPPGLASHGSRFTVPMSGNSVHLVVTGITEETHDFQRAAFERC